MLRPVNRDDYTTYAIWCFTPSQPRQLYHVCNLVFYAQSTVTVRSGRGYTTDVQQTDKQQDGQTDKSIRCLRTVALIVDGRRMPSIVQQGANTVECFHGIIDTGPQYLSEPFHLYTHCRLVTLPQIHALPKCIARVPEH